MLIEESNTIVYTWGPYGEDEYEYEVSADEYADYFSYVSSSMSDEDKVDIINKYSPRSSYNSDYDLDDQFHEVFDDYIKYEGYDDYKDYFEEAARSAYEDYQDYKKDPYKYYGLSTRDFY